MLKVIYLLLVSFLLFGEVGQCDSLPSDTISILFVVSNADQYGSTGIAASNHFAELVLPYDVLIKQGYTIDFVSPDGGAVPLGYFDTSDPLIKSYLYDCDFMNKLATTATPLEIDPSKYAAIYYGGGGSAMFGVANNEAINNVATHIYEKNNGIVSAVCHGSYGLSNILLSNGQYLVSGKKVNGFPDLFENTEASYFSSFEDSVQGALTKRGALFSFSEEGWDGYYMADGRLITGQDPSSAAKVAELIIEQIQKRK